MKLSKITSTLAVLFLAATLPVYAQKDEKDNGRGQPQRAQETRPQAKPQQPKPAVQQPRAQNQGYPQRAAAPAQQQPKPSPVHNPEQHSRSAARQPSRTPPPQHAPIVRTHVQAPREQRSERQVQSWQQQRGWVKQGGGWQPHTSFQQGRDQHWASDHRSWAQRGGYGGSYIPQASFGTYFGSSHFFHIGAMPAMYMGYPRFAYGGYSFMLLDPWPESWRTDWYASDDVYIDYSDGYYLHDRRYPGVSLAVSVVL
ncbi:MAG TPA: hypothetical protein VN519_06165 [Bryobacteraceae bacterium]|nr:hypothetical protein [Bryobacteraceae bacterium]